MKQGFTRIAILLDRSGSMKSMIEHVITGLNKFFDEQKALPGYATVRLCQFDTLGYDVVFDKPLSDVPMLTQRDFEPRAGTPLWDSQARIINDLGEELGALPEGGRPENVVVVTMTDGEENSSQKYRTAASVKVLVDHQTKKYGWHFVYLGANQDAVKVGMAMGITMDNAMTYSDSERGVMNTTSSLNSYMRSVRATRSASFTPADRSAAVEK